MEIIILLIKLCLISWFWVSFPLFELIPTLIIETIELKWKLNSNLKQIILKPFQCYKCAGFWISLIYILIFSSFNLWWMPIAVSFLMDQYDRHLNTINI